MKTALLTVLLSCLPALVFAEAPASAWFNAQPGICPVCGRPMPKEGGAITRQADTPEVEAAKKKMTPHQGIIRRLSGPKHTWTGELRHHLEFEHRVPSNRFRLYEWTESAVKKLHDNLHNHGKSGISIEGSNEQVECGMMTHASEGSFYKMDDGQVYKIPQQPAYTQQYQPAYTQPYQPTFMQPYSSQYNPGYGNLTAFGRMTGGGCGNPACRMCYGGGGW